MKPPFTITSPILNGIAKIERLIGRIESLNQPKPQPFLRKSNRVRTVQGSLAIEGNTLSLEQVTALIDGKRVIGDKKDIKEVLNAIDVYELLPEFKPFVMKELLKAHRVMMSGLIKSSGKWRSINVGVMKGDAVAHVAPQADRVHHLMKELFAFTKNKETHLLIRGCIFHYELELIHPFEDGNGRFGRFWHSVLLYHYHPVFEFIPVESLIREHQKEYYTALEKSDKSGDSAPFIEFALSVIHEALTGFLEELKPEPLTVEGRLDIAEKHFGNSEFSRKDYIKLFKTLSTATASRDLKFGVEQKQLLKEGDKAKANYQFFKRGHSKETVYSDRIMARSLRLEFEGAFTT